MPGKVNPVIAESVIQIAAQVIGNDATITVSGQVGNFELSVMLPVVSHNLLQSISILGLAAKNFAGKCINGITANEATCSAFVENSLALCTALVPVIGYENAAAIAHEAYTAGKTVREVAMKKEVLPEAQLTELLDPVGMT